MNILCGCALVDTGIMVECISHLFLTKLGIFSPCLIQCRYVPTDVNPADHLTRGSRVSELMTLQCWWTAPEYLQFPEANWPVNKVSKSAVIEVRRKYSRGEGSFLLLTWMNYITKDENLCGNLTQSAF